MISSCPTSNRLILRVADDQAILRYGQALLERSGYAVLTAVSARQALRLVTMCKCDAALLAYGMPVRRYDLAFQMKHNCPELIIMLLSGSEVPTHMLVLVDAVVPRLEARQRFLPMIAELRGRNHDALQKEERLQTGDQQ